AVRRRPDAVAGPRGVGADSGAQGEAGQTIQDLLRDLRKLPGARGPASHEQAQLSEAQGAMRVFFDLFAAKASLALAGDPDERSRLLSLIPRTDDRRHLRREPTRASG